MSDSSYPAEARNRNQAAASSRGARFPIVLVGTGYWGGLMTWLREKVHEEGNIYADELDLVAVVDEPEEVVRIITKAHAQIGFTTPVTGVDGT